MKIHILPIHDELQPDHADFIWPNHNEDWGVEQDFLCWLNQSGMVTEDAGEADYSLLPIFWNRLYLNEGGPGDEGLVHLLSDGVTNAILEPERTFTICEYDVRARQPWLNLDGVTVFTANRELPDSGIDIPLLCSPHTLPEPMPPKQYLTSFIGHPDTHPLRREMIDALSDKPDCYVTSGNEGADFFVNLLASSYVALAPRGDGGQSFRFYEAMQVGTVPLLISDIDTRPFKRWLDWDCASFYVAECDLLYEALLVSPKDWYIQPGADAAHLWEEDLQYGKWCRYVIMELDNL